MSFESSPARVVGIGHNGPPEGIQDTDYWHGLIDTKLAATFLGLEPRTRENWRQKGKGPEFTEISSRCKRYTRARLKIFSDERVRRSNSDPGNGAAE